MHVSKDEVKINIKRSISALEVSNCQRPGHKAEEFLHLRPYPLLPFPWWEVFIGCDRSQDLSSVCNAILALGDENNMDNRRAKYAFVPSLLEESSFNDPESFLWPKAD